MNITVTVQDAQVQAALKRLRDKVGNLKPAMEEIGQRYRRSVLENFANESSPDGTPWAPTKARSIAAQYKKSKTKKKGGLRVAYERYLAGKKILFRSGRLKERIHAAATATSVTIGNSDAIKYAAVHQFGSAPGSKNKIPARPWLALNRGTELELAPKDKAMVLEVLEKHLNS
jgi:phage virion morphogenesis protein